MAILREIIRSIGPDNKEVISNAICQYTGEYISFKQIDYIPNVIDNIMFIKDPVSNISYIRVFNGVVNVKWFGAKGDYNKTTKLGTNDTAAFNKAIAFMDYARASTLYLPDGNYLITPTLYVNFGGSRPFTLLGSSGKPYTSTASITGASICVNDSGDLFRINLTESGASFQAIDLQYLAFSVKNVSFYCAEEATVNIFKMFRTGCSIEDVAVDGANWLVLQENTDINGNATYCDKSVFNNIRINNPKLGGLRLSKSDNTSVTNITFEGARFIYQKGIEIVGADGVYINNILCWYKETITPLAGSALFNIVNCNSVRLGVFHLERSPFNTWFNISGCIGVNISEVFTKFQRRHGFVITGQSKGVNIKNWFSYDNLLTGGYVNNIYDAAQINYDILIGSGTEKVTYEHCYFASNPDKVFRDISIDYNDPNQIRPVIFPKSIRVGGVTTAYTLLPNGSVILGNIAVNTPLDLPSFLNHLGEEIVIFNTNTGVGKWYLKNPTTGANSFVKNADGSDLTFLKDQRVYVLENASLTNNGWRVKVEYIPESYYDKKYIQSFSSDLTVTSAAALNSTYGSFIAGTTVSYPNYTGGWRKYTKKDNSVTSEWGYVLVLSGY